ncbi:hypothetical protein U9R90_05465 [Streptomyces sp. E11-3]|uniref:DUF6197 family protein n=1 Tax=Streptomyces sp. E11-3 TaxID=3110112 RepID=UPI0039810DAC
MTGTIAPPTVAEVADICDKAACHMDRVGFHQGALYSGCQADAGTPLEGCRVDVVGALNFAAHGSARFGCEDGPERRAALRAEVAVQNHLGADLIDWNDAAERTKEQVVQALRDTATGLRAGVTP